MQDTENTVNYFSHLFLSNSMLYCYTIPCMKIHSHILVSSYGFVVFQYIYISINNTYTKGTRTVWNKV